MVCGDNIGGNSNSRIHHLVFSRRSAFLVPYDISSGLAFPYVCDLKKRKKVGHFEHRWCFQSSKSVLLYWKSDTVAGVLLNGAKVECFLGKFAAIWLQIVIQVDNKSDPRVIKRQDIKKVRSFRGLVVGHSKALNLKAVGVWRRSLTDPSIENKGLNCAAGLECLLNIIRALRMGSCLSAESRSPLPDSPSSPGGWGGVRRRKTAKKRLGSRNSSFDYRRDEPLHRIPGRMFLNGSSEVASLFTQQGKKGTNQDAMIVWENFGSRTDTVFCGVFDGHGPYGHMVAKRVRDSLALKLSAHWEVNITNEEVLKEINLNNAGSLNSDDTAFVSVDEDFRASVDAEETEKNSDIFQTLKESFLKAFKVMDRELRTQPSIDCFCSGTTAVTLIKQGRDLIIGNVGDSRAVMGTRDKDDTLTAVQLTVDLKPNLPAEAERIRKCRGRVFALQDEPEVSRVWLPNNDSPGLAMARAFGDFCLKDFGLISVPDVSYRRLSEKDEFIVLATDGIWDVLSNKEVVDIIASAPARSSASRALVETAVQAWRQKYPTSKVDDCAVVCLFLDANAAKIGSNENHCTEDEVNAGSEQEDNSGPPLVRSGTVLTAEEILQQEEEEEDDEEGGGSKENGAEEMNSEVGIEWSALEGVSRVNTLLNLPRFVPTKEDRKVWKKV